MRRFEITMLDDGGFIVGRAEPGSAPRFACSQLGDALAYLEKQFEALDRLKHTDAGSQLNRGPSLATPEQMAVFARASDFGRCSLEPANFVTKTQPPSQRVQPPPAPPATKAPTRLSDGLPIGSPPAPTTVAKGGVPPAKDD